MREKNLYYASSEAPASKRKKGRIIWILAALPVLLVLIFLVYASVYYHADETALAALQSDEAVTVKQEKSGWLFDGPSEERLFIFYPGAKVEEISYAPLLHRLAGMDMDVWLVRMPLRFAIFGMNRAEEIIRDSSYGEYLIGGHSLGGAMAAVYAADHGDELAGLILLAAYPMKVTDTDTLLIYGSEDEVLNRERVRKAEELITGRYRECVIEGGSHAWFGNYGKQRGDGIASVTADEQQAQTIEAVKDFFASASK